MMSEQERAAHEARLLAYMASFPRRELADGRTLLVQPMLAGKGRLHIQEGNDTVASY